MGEVVSDIIMHVVFAWTKPPNNKESHTSERHDDVDAAWPSRGRMASAPLTVTSPPRHDGDPSFPMSEGHDDVDATGHHVA